MIPDNTTARDLLRQAGGNVNNLAGPRYLEKRKKLAAALGCSKFGVTDLHKAATSAAGVHSPTCRANEIRLIADWAYNRNQFVMPEVVDDYEAARVLWHANAHAQRVSQTAAKVSVQLEQIGRTVEACSFMKTTCQMQGPHMEALAEVRRILQRVQILLSPGVPA